MVGSTTPSQAWAILSRHARDDIAPLRLKDLCTDDDRITSLVTVHSGSSNASSRFTTSAKHTNFPLRNLNRTLIADLSRQRMTLETLNYLLRLATAVDVRGFIHTLAWGQNNRLDPVSSPNSAPSTERSRHFFGDTRKSTNSNARTMNMPLHHYHEEASTVAPQPTSNQPLSPSRSVISSNHVKKTRFATDDDNSHLHLNQHSDDLSIAHSYQPHSPSPSHLSPANKVPLQTSPSMHIALRAPSHCNLQMLTSNGTNALDDIHSQWKRMQLVSMSIRRGQMKGVSGHFLTNILVIGKGVAFSGVQFMYDALKNDEQGFDGLCSGLSDRRGGGVRIMRFLSTLDPVSIHSALSDWIPEQTCVVSIVMNEEEEDMLRLTQVVKKWLLEGMKSNSKREDIIIGKHLLFVTGSDTLYHSQSVTKSESSFLIPSFARCEAFTTTSVAGLLPLSIAFGWEVVQEILNGAHDLDTHFVETNPRYNLPVLLALVDLWNDHFLPSSSSYKPCGGKMITPFIESLASFPSFVAALEAQVCGRANTGERTRNPYCHVAPSGLVVDGGLCGAFDRVVYQGRRAPPCELVTAMEPQLPSRRVDKDLMRFYNETVYGGNEQSNQDRSMCSFFAHADVMAFGSSGYRSRDARGGSSVHTTGGSSAFGHGLGSASFDSQFPSTPQAGNDNDIANGNRPSSLLICSRCDPFTVGQLIALSEHRALISAKLWDVEHYAFTQSHGSNIRTKQIVNMREKLDLLYQRLGLVGYLNEDDKSDPVGGPNLNLATTSLLGHYAFQMHNQKMRFDSKH
jgi:glucose-6-phosphate isomerase